MACLVALVLAAPATAHGPVGAADTHGPDPAHVDAGTEAAAPAGGAEGKPLSPEARGKVDGGRARFRLPARWCGTPRSSDDRDHELDNGAYRYHAVYAIPADGADRFGELATTLQTDAFQASALLEQAYGRAIRFDLGTDCGPQYLDISVVRLPHTTAQLQDLAGAPNGTLDAVMDGLNAAGFPTIRPNETLEEAAARNRNYVVWIDGPAPTSACGQATSYDDPARGAGNLNNLGGKVAVVFPNDGGGFCSSNTVRHEIGHTLGAVQRAAPHVDADGVHCVDAYEDTMCTKNAPIVSTRERGLYFDHGNDDYWDPPQGPALPWWTVNLNRFLCQDATCNVASSGGSADLQGDAGADASPAPDAKVRLKARRTKNGWKVTVTARGQGEAVVVVRCRPTPRRAVRTVLAKRTVLPRTISKTVRCATRPQASVLPKRSRA